MPRRLKIVYVTQEELFDIAREYGSVRGGATVDPAARAYEYGYEGYIGTMYVARTQNMMKAEDRLLEANFRHNIHELSNASESSGYIYVVSGQKRQNNWLLTPQFSNYDNILKVDGYWRIMAWFYCDSKQIGKFISSTWRRIVYIRGHP